MTEISIRRIVGCLESGSQSAAKASGNLSVLNHFFGYTTVPDAPAGVIETVKVGRQARLLRSAPHVDINAIYVGLDGLSDSAQLSIDRTVDNAIAVSRRAYAEVGIAIGHVKRGRILAADAEGFEHLESQGEGAELFDTFSSSESDGIDVFFVRSYKDCGDDKGGMSPCPGGCDQDGKNSGVAVVHQVGNGINLGIVLGHEMGHYLGLPHTDEDSPSDPFNMMSEGQKGSTASFSSGQGRTMREHCKMLPPCP